jgi:cytochrome c biogenesis factor
VSQARSYERAIPYGLRVDTWYDYRTVWGAHPWVLLVFVLAVACVVAGVIGTAATNVLAILFIPGLLLGYGHHLIVTRKYG